MSYIEKCVCGGTFRQEEGLEGMFCDVCGAHKDLPPSAKLFTIDKAVEKSYTEDKLKSIRGVPVNRIILSLIHI